VLDAATDSPAEPRSLTGPDDAVLVIDGPYLNRPELSGFWNYSVWVDVDAEPPAAQQLYVREVSPRTRATAIVDNTDVEHPRRSFADSC
jgi:uridine kinase